MERTWRSAAARGSIGLVHPESHFTEEKAALLRAATYRRLRRHWHFKNKKKLFEDLTDQLEFGVHIYAADRVNPEFIMAASLYEPETAIRSMMHDGTGEAPALKTLDGEWDTRPHLERIVKVDRKVLEVWASILDKPGTPAGQAKTIYPVNQDSSSVLRKLVSAPRIRDLKLEYSRGWDESIDPQKGYFVSEVRVPISWTDVILQGPHITVWYAVRQDPPAGCEQQQRLG